MKVWTENDRAVLRCQFQEKELVKAIGEYKFDKAAATWNFPLRKLVDLIDNLNLQYDDKTLQIYQDLVKQRSENHARINLADRIKKGELSPQEMQDFILQYGLQNIDMQSCYEHQRKAIMLGAMFGSYALFFDMGLGKTKTMIHLFEYFKTPAMVVAPLSTLESVWMKEIEKWSKLRKIILWNHLERFNDDYDVYLINYEGFKKLLKKEKIEKKVKILVIDEVSKLKSYSSQISKDILSIKNKIDHRFCLSGTPAPNSLLEYFNSVCFINEELLGSNYFKFRNTYFYGTGYGGYTYRPYANAKETIMQNVSKQAYALKKEDCLSLPEKINEERTVYMDEVQQTAYDAMLKENIMEFQNNTALGVNELAKICKLREISGGFVINTRGIPIKISDSKIIALKDTIEEIGEERQIIIWIQYHWEAETIKKELGEEAVIFAGMIKQSEKDQNINDFISGKKRILIAHPRSAGYGLNLQNCNYVIWYSISYSYEEYTQACDRCHRAGQPRNVTYVHLLAKKTIDEVIYKAIIKKQKLSDTCLAMLKGNNI